jgi:hypothetical protein
MIQRQKVKIECIFFVLNTRKMFQLTSPLTRLAWAHLPSEEAAICADVTNLPNFTKHTIKELEYQVIEHTATVGWTEGYLTLRRSDHSNFIHWAAANGNLSALRQFKENLFLVGNTVKFFADAGSRNHIQMMKFLKANYRTPTMGGFIDAIRNGSIHALRQLKKWETLNLEVAFHRAAECNQIRILKLLRGWGGQPPDIHEGWLPIYARPTMKGHLKVLKLLLKWQLVTPPELLRASAQYGKIQSAHVAKKRGANDFNGMLWAAARARTPAAHHLAIMKLAKDWGAAQFAEYGPYTLNDIAPPARELLESWQ